MFENLNDPAKREVVIKAVKEISDAMARKQAETTLISEIKKHVKEETDLAGTDLTKLVKMYDDHTVLQKSQDVNDLFEVLFSKQD